MFTSGTGISAVIIVAIAAAIVAGGCGNSTVSREPEPVSPHVSAEPGITFQDQQAQAEYFMKKLNIPVKRLNRQDLEEEISAFLKNTQCLTLATVNPDGSPHQTLLDYVSDGLDIYIASAGGQKFVNLAGDTRVSVAIGFTGGTVESEYGLTIDGTAEVFKAPHPRFVAGMMKMKPFLEEWSKSVQPMENIIKKVVTARIIKITPHRMTYMNMPKGIVWARWKREGGSS